MRVLTPVQREQFEAEGYVVVDGVLDPAKDLAPIIAECEKILDGIAEALFRASPNPVYVWRSPVYRSSGAGLH